MSFLDGFSVSMPGISEEVMELARNYKGPEKSAYDKLREKQAQEASKFRENIPTYLSQLGEASDIGVREKLSKDLSASKVNANRRGLLGSGLHRFGDESRRAEAASEAFQNRVNLERDLGKQADSYDYAVAQAGQDAYRGNIADADAAYQRALSDRQAQNAFTSGILGLGGALGGAALAGSKKDPKDKNTGAG